MINPDDKRSPLTLTLSHQYSIITSDQNIKFKWIVNFHFKSIISSSYIYRPKMLFWNDLCQWINKIRTTWRHEISSDFFINLLESDYRYTLLKWIKRIKFFLSSIALIHNTELKFCPNALFHPFNLKLNITWIKNRFICDKVCAN